MKLVPSAKDIKIDKHIRTTVHIPLDIADRNNLIALKKY